MQCVKDIFPDSNIEPHVTDNYPIRVIVTAQLLANGTTVEIWSGPQQSLFRKNGVKRDQSIATIKSSLTKLRRQQQQQQQLSSSNL
jgi:hypothetical protein